MSDPWQPGKFLTALVSGATEVDGYTHKGLGLYLVTKPSPKGRRPAEWCLVHLGSGHAVAWLTGTVATAFPVASDVADLTDWTAFDRVDGWKQVDPELNQKIWVLRSRHAKALRVAQGGTQSDEIAREIAYARA